MIVVDEAHHAAAPGYRAVIDHFHTAKIVGFTATADRLDGENLGSVFESVAYEYNIRQAIQEGWLVPIEAVQLSTDPPIDLKDLRIVGGDFNQGDLEKAINANIGRLVSSLVDTGSLQARRTLAFTPDVSSAQALSNALNDVNISADWVSGKSTNRADVFERHQTGKFQVLVNCMIATEGYDDPEVSCILICRPTKSRALFSQMCGRGTRLHPESGKVNCRIVDFAYLTGRHKLVGPVDLYDHSEIPDEVVEKARKKVETGEQPDLELAIEEAQGDYETSRRARIERIATQVRARKFNPLEACDFYGVQAHKDHCGFSDTTPATAKQLETLQMFGVQTTADTPKHIASALLNKIFARLDHGWASPSEVRQLIESGYEVSQALGTRSKDAKAYLDANPLGPSSAQAYRLKQCGVSAREIERMTRKQASVRLSELLGK
jgi:type I site-specific restriction endonuclease